MSILTNYYARLNQLANDPITMDDDYSKLTHLVKNKQSLSTELEDTNSFFSALSLHYFYCTESDQITKIKSILRENLELFKPHLSYDTIFTVTSDKDSEKTVEVSAKGLFLAMKTPLIDQLLREAAKTREPSAFFRLTLKEFTEKKLSALMNEKILPRLRLDEVKNPDTTDTMSRTRAIIGKYSPRPSPRTPSRLSREISNGCLVDSNPKRSSISEADET